jgi:hypothetical protein
MTDKLFFRLDDVRAIRPISKHIDNFDVIAREVMINYVERLLGSDLYAELQDDLQGGFAQTTRFQELIAGTRYEYQGQTKIFRGLKDYACYVWLYLWLLDDGLQVTPIGAQLFKDEEAEAAHGKQQYAQLRDHAIRMADGMEEGIMEFLEKDTRFPEYANSNKEEPAEASNFTFRTIGQTQVPPFNPFHR